jgi:hypothetical protein
LFSLLRGSNLERFGFVILQLRSLGLSGGGSREFNNPATVDPVPLL